MKDLLNHFLIDDLGLTPSIHEITLTFSEETVFNRVYSDICVYTFDNIKEKKIIEDKIKKRFKISSKYSLNNSSIENELQINIHSKEKKVLEINLYAVSKILLFEDAIQINRALFPRCTLN